MNNLIEQNSRTILLIILTFILSGCSLLTKLLPEGGQSRYTSCLDLFSENNEWQNETSIEIIGYDDSAMEPRISADQNLLLFNNKAINGDDMDVHYAVRENPIKNPNRYTYKGILKGADSNKLDGTPGLDKFGNFYFVSLRDYGKNYQSIYSAQLTETAKNQFELKNIQPADDYVTRAHKLMIDMDGEVSWDGSTMISSRADFVNQTEAPRTSYLALFNVSFSDGVSKRVAMPNKESSFILANVNLPECRVYAGSLSENKLELFYTILTTSPNVKPDDFRIVVAKRKSTNESFGRGQIISAIKGNIIEGPSVSLDDGGNSLYYHKLDSTEKRFKIYKVMRK
ncbi:MAG: hypothetical protein ABL930_07960 [Pseudobdellovibrio sp.]